MNRRVLIFRAELLQPSETFIAAQVGALRRYDAMFAGLRRCSPSLPMPAPSISPSIASLAQKLILKRVGLRQELIHDLSRKARAWGPALLHSHFAVDAAAVLPLRQALGVPIVVTLHGYDVMCSDAAHEADPRGRLYLARRRQLWEQAHSFICVSRSIQARALAAGFPRHKLRVLPIGVDTGLLPLQVDRKAEQTQQPVILFVGRLVEKKGCDTLIRAMRVVQKTLPGARLIVAGDGPLRQELQALAGQLTLGTSFVGPQSPDAVRGLMEQATCLAAPSQTAADGDAEGLPLVLCEALSLGLPVAATFHSGIPELIRHGIEGLLCEERDQRRLADHLVQLCTQPALARRLRQAGRARVERLFDLQTQTTALERLYDEVLAQQVRPHSGVRQTIVPAMAAAADTAPPLTPPARSAPPTRRQMEGRPAERSSQTDCGSAAT